MRTWEQAQGRRIGKTREKIAEMIREAIPGIKIEAEDISIQNPYWASRQGGCVLWYGWGEIIHEDGSGGSVGVNSWCRMSDLVKTGLEAIQDGCSYIYEIVPKEKES